MSETRGAEGSSMRDVRVLALIPKYGPVPDRCGVCRANVFAAVCRVNVCPWSIGATCHPGENLPVYPVCRENKPYPTGIDFTFSAIPVFFCLANIGQRFFFLFARVFFSGAGIGQTGFHHDFFRPEFGRAMRMDASCRVSLSRIGPRFSRALRDIFSITELGGIHSG